MKFRDNIKYEIGSIKKIIQLWRDIKKSPFKMPKVQSYFGEKQFGTPYFVPTKKISLNISSLGWKDKFNSPRFEWQPLISFVFFKFQYIVWLRSPNNDDDLYWEMFLTYKYYSNEDIDDARKKWGWVDGDTNKTTWDNTLLK